MRLCSEKKKLFVFTKSWKFPEKNFKYQSQRNTKINPRSRDNFFYNNTLRWYFFAADKARFEFETSKVCLNVIIEWHFQVIFFVRKLLAAAINNLGAL